jgi:hypothetical protein
MVAARPVLSSEEWDYLDVDVLRPARSGAVCITCQHFRYEVGRHCVTVLTCPIHQGLIPQGEHLTKRCAQWVARREVAVGSHPSQEQEFSFWGMGDPIPDTSSGFPPKNAPKRLRQNGFGGNGETAVPPKIPPNAEGAPMRQ